MRFEPAQRDEAAVARSLLQALDSIVPALQDVLTRLETLAPLPDSPPGRGQPGSEPGERRLTEPTLTVASGGPVGVAQPDSDCPRCGGLVLHTDAAANFFHWLRRLGWQGAVQHVILECEWGVFAWRGDRDDLDGRIVCLLVQDEDLPAAFTEVLERIETGRTQPQPPPHEVVRWEHWAPTALVPVPPPGPPFVGRITSAGQLPPLALEEG